MNQQVCSDIFQTIVKQNLIVFDYFGFVNLVCHSLLKVRKWTVDKSGTSKALDSDTCGQKWTLFSSGKGSVCRRYLFMSSSETFVKCL